MKNIDEQWSEIKRWLAFNRKKFNTTKNAKFDDLGIIDRYGYICVYPKHFREMLGRDNFQTMKILADTQCIFSHMEGETRCFTEMKSVGFGKSARARMVCLNIKVEDVFKDGEK